MNKLINTYNIFILIFIALTVIFPNIIVNNTDNILIRIICVLLIIYYTKFNIYYGLFMCLFIILLNYKKSISIFEGLSGLPKIKLPPPPPPPPKPKPVSLPKLSTIKKDIENVGKDAIKKISTIPGKIESGGKDAIQKMSTIPGKIESGGKDAIQKISKISLPFGKEGPRGKTGPPGPRGKVGPPGPAILPVLPIISEAPKPHEMPGTTTTTTTTTTTPSSFLVEPKKKPINCNQCLVNSQIKKPIQRENNNADLLFKFAKIAEPGYYQSNLTINNMEQINVSYTSNTGKIPLNYSFANFNEFRSFLLAKGYDKYIQSNIQPHSSTIEQFSLYSSVYN